jgi:hypothetical protein
MTCQQAMALVQQIEDEMAPWPVAQRKLARERWFLLFPQAPDVPGIEQEMNAQATQATVNSIGPLAEYLSAGNPDVITSTVNALRQQQQTLYENESKGFGNANSDSSEWQGTSADGFRNYLNDTESDYRVAQDALSDLATLYELYGQLVSECHADLISILQNGLNAYQNVDQQWTAVLTTASVGLSVATASTLVLAGLAAVTSAGPDLANEIKIDGSSDLSTAQSIVAALDALKDNTNARATQLNGTLAELGSKINSAISDVQNNVPKDIPFALPGQPFDPSSFQPTDGKPSKPVSTSPLIPGLASGGISHLLNV